MKRDRTISPKERQLLARITDGVRPTPSQAQTVEKLQRYGFLGPVVRLLPVVTEKGRAAILEVSRREPWDPSLFRGRTWQALMAAQARRDR